MHLSTFYRKKDPSDSDHIKLMEGVNAQFFISAFLHLPGGDCHAHVQYQRAASRVLECTCELNLCCEANVG